MTGDGRIGIEEHREVFIAPITAIHEDKMTIRRGKEDLRVIPIKKGIVDADR